MKSSLALASAALLAWAASPARAVVVNLGPSRDTTIFQNNVNNSSGGGNGLFAGTNGTGSPRRGLVGFNLGGVVPTGATIQNVQLTLTLGQVAGSGGGGGTDSDQTIELHRLSADWGEGTVQKVTPPTDSLGGQGQGAAAAAGDATWNARMFSATTPTLWTTPGGDFAAAASATAAVNATVNNAFVWGSTAALVADVQGWVNNPATNFGWLVKNADETTATNFRAFYTRDVATAAFFPKLTITYAIPEPAGLASVAPGAFAAAARRRRGLSRRPPLEKSDE